MSGHSCHSLDNLSLSRCHSLFDISTPPHPPALLKATSAQTSALVAAAQGARSSLEIAKLARKAESIAVNRATWALKSVKEAAKAEEVAVNAIQSLFV